MLEENGVVFLCSAKVKQGSFLSKLNREMYVFASSISKTVKTSLNAFSWHIKHNSEHWKEIDLTGKSSS